MAKISARGDSELSRWELLLRPDDKERTIAEYVETHQGRLLRRLKWRRDGRAESTGYQVVSSKPENTQLMLAQLSQRGARRTRW